MDAKQMAQAYKNRQVMTATPEELTLMLYNGAIKFGLESAKALAKKDHAAASAANIKVQNIITTLANTLDMQYPISKDWRRLYEYIVYTLIQANVDDDAAKLDEAMEMVREFRDTWKEAMKRARMESAAASQQTYSHEEGRRA